jgi:hypothetical protein
MSQDHKTGLYEKAVQRITEWVKPRLHETTKEFVAKAIDEEAKGNPRYAKIIEFEVRRRGDGAGLTQDVAEPLLWTGIKTGLALGIATLTHSLHNKKFQMIGYATAVGLVLNNAVEWLRLMPRYKAGLQGSLEMAKDRWKAIEETGIDPFSNQTRDARVINKDIAEPVRWTESLSAGKETEPSQPAR